MEQGINVKSTSLLILSVVLSVGLAEAKDIFVDNQAGSDLFAGAAEQDTSGQNGPVRSIAKAMRLAEGGDRIVLRKTDQPYRESITLAGSRFSGLLRPFTIEGNGATLDGSAAMPADAWRHFRGNVFAFQPPRMGYPQLFLNDRPGVRVLADRLSQEVPDLQPFQWCSVGGVIYFCTEKAKSPGEYPLSYAAQQSGITLYHVDHVTIRDLTVQGFQIDGIALANSARDVSLVSVTCRGNGRCGISVGGASSARIDDALLGDNGQAQLLTFAYSETSIRNSHLLVKTAPGWVDQGGRVFLGNQRVHGGRDEIHPETTGEGKP